MQPLTLRWICKSLWLTCNNGLRLKLTKAQRKHYEKLAELGYNPIPGGDDYFEFNKKKASELDWFYHLTGGLTHTDFFAMRPTDYSKAGEGENWDDLF